MVSSLKLTAIVCSLNGSQRYGTLKFLNFQTPKILLKYPKIRINLPYSREMPPKDSDGIATSEDPDQTAPRTDQTAPLGAV